MKIIFSSQNKNWDSNLDERFGRAKGFVLYDEETNKFSWHSNQDNLNAAHGAGIQSAQFVINTGASGHISSRKYLSNLIFSSKFASVKYPPFIHSVSFR